MSGPAAAGSVSSAVGPAACLAWGGVSRRIACPAPRGSIAGAATGPAACLAAHHWSECRLGRGARCLECPARESILPVVYMTLYMTV